MCLPALVALDTDPRHWLSMPLLRLPLETRVFPLPPPLPGRLQALATVPSLRNPPWQLENNSPCSTVLKLLRRPVATRLPWTLPGMPPRSHRAVLLLSELALLVVFLGSATLRLRHPLSVLAAPASALSLLLRTLPARLPTKRRVLALAGTADLVLGAHLAKHPSGASELEMLPASCRAGLRRLDTASQMRLSFVFHCFSNHHGDNQAGVFSERCSTVYRALCRSTAEACFL